MSTNPFEEAGKKYLDRAVRESASHDQAVEALKNLASFCETGVSQFYSGKSDVYVNRVSDTQFQVCYGYRPSKHRGVLSGPYAQVVVFPDGKILWAHQTEWQTVGSCERPFHGEVLDSTDYTGAITPKLIVFFTESEEDYRRNIV